MITAEENERLARVGPGTPMGSLLRRYWHPVAATSELENPGTKKVRLLGEDLILYKDKSGSLGLIGDRCPHRRVSMEYGIPEADGLRCPYHGWLYNQEGRCTEQPGEPWDSTFKDRITITAYPAEELGGLIFAYLGPLPAPLLPRWEPFVIDNAIREVGATVLPCNWLQIMENSLDPVHVEWLHGSLMEYANALRGERVPKHPGRHKKIGFSLFEYGITKRRTMDTADYGDEEDAWKFGHPIIFPNMLAGKYSFQIRVPIDDTHTWHLWYSAHRPGIPVPPQKTVPIYDMPITDENGKILVHLIDGQDMYAWITQGDLARRDLEHLGVSDIGVIMYRELLAKQMTLANEGVDPMNVFRDPSKNQYLNFPTEREGKRYGGRVKEEGAINYPRKDYNPYWKDIEAAYREAAQRGARGEELLPVVYAPEGAILDHREAKILP